MRHLQPHVWGFGKTPTKGEALSADHHPFHPKFLRPFLRFVTMLGLAMQSRLQGLDGSFPL